MLTSKFDVFHHVGVLIVVTGLLLSNLYVPLHVALFHALSFAHKYNTCVHSLLPVITVPLLKLVPFPQSALSHLYFTHVNHDTHPSLTLNVIAISPVYRVLVLLLFALTVGFSLSIHVTSAVHVLEFHNLSVNVTLCCPFPVNVLLCGVAVLNHTHASLAGMLAVTFPFVHVFGVYVISPHTGAVASYV